MDQADWWEAALHFHRFQAGHHEVEDEQREEVGRAGEYEDGGVTAGGIFEHADNDLKDGTAHCAGKGADADDAADRFAGEDIGGERVEIGGECLVRGCSEAD